MTHSKVQELFTEYFPNTPVIMTFGNNDCKHHDNAPFKAEKEEFYDFMFNLWFNLHPANQKFARSTEETFKNGGYFKIEVTDKLSVLSMNTL